MNGVPPPPPPGFGAGPSSIPPPPPLPPGWTEHIAPGGQKYWYNAQTQVSTYTRPIPAFVGGPPPPPPPAGFPSAAPVHAGVPADTVATSSTASSTKPKKEKKEKPVSKREIEGTEWIRVETNKGNVFWSNKATKQSVWTEPDQVKEAEQKAKEREEEEKQAAKKRKAEEEEQAEEAKAKAARGDKDDASPPANKKRRKDKPVVVHEIEEIEQDEEFQERIADQLAQEELEKQKPVMLDEPHEPEDKDGVDEEAQARAQEQAEEEARAMDEEVERRAQALKEQQQQPTVSPEEAAAMFKALLAEKDINPMAPWDMELPKFVGDSRYAAVKTLRERKDLFDEFCKDKIREQRAAKKASAQPKVDPLTAYRNLLIATVTSTRTHFSDFKRAHGKDPRYRDFQKTDSEKEKIFKNWLRELGERKRNEAKAAEERFTQMLKEDKLIKPGDEWAAVKTRHASDPRYSAVASSSARESLFKTYVATLTSASADGGKADRAAKAAASLREREERVRAEKERAESLARRAKGAMGHEEAEREFMTLLVDAVRSHEARWNDVVDALARDPRFESHLSDQEKRRMFDEHCQKLYAKRLAAVEALFASHSPKLTTRFEQVLPLISSDANVSRLVGDDYERLEALYDKWAAQRQRRAREEFTELLTESPLIEHWVRLQKQEATKDGEGVIEDGEEEGDDALEGPVDVREMAKQIDAKAIHASLKNDARYTQWNHVPEERERWVDEYISQVGAPKATVHQGRS